jgi:hypothetical protein
MPITKNKKEIKEFLPAAFKLQIEKEAKEAEERSKFSDGPALYLKAPKEGKNPKSGLPEPGSVEFRVLSEAVFGWTLWYTNEEGQRRCMRWADEDLTAQGIEGGAIPEEMLPPNYETKGDKIKKPKIAKALFMAIYNITEDAIQMWDLDKSTMIDQFIAAVTNPSFGNAKDFDFIWSRTGELTDTVHTLQPQPPYELPPEYLKRYEDANVNVEAHARNLSLDQIWGHIEPKTDD